MKQIEVSPVGRINAMLPDRLAHHVGEVIGTSGLYENASEFIRDLIRRHMEAVERNERDEVNSLLLQSIQESDYSDWTDDDTDNLHAIATGKVE